MDIEKVVQEIKKVVASVQTDVPLRQYTSFRIGGSADCVANVATEEELAELMRLLADSGTRYYLLGGGCNTLFADEGFRGVIVRLCGKFAECECVGGEIIAGAACSNAKAATVALNNSLAGAEFLHGIPGLIGGAVYMNAGAYGGEICQIVTSTKYMDDNFNIVEISNAAHEFSYRHSRFAESGGIILRTTLTLAQGNQAEIKSRMDDFATRRKSKQPLEYPSAGSAFKRPPNGYASQLIDEAGLKGLRIGGAAVSEKHAGFIVNLGGATAADVVALIEVVQERIHAKFGIMLEPEVRIVKAM